MARPRAAVPVASVYYDSTSPLQGFHIRVSHEFPSRGGVKVVALPLNTKNNSVFLRSIVFYILYILRLRSLVDVGMLY